MTDSDWYDVKDIDEFVKAARSIIYNNFGSWDKKQGNSEVDIIDDMITKPSDEEEFNQLLTQEESIVIIKPLFKKQKNKRTSKIRYLISDDIFLNMLQQLNDRMVSNTISSLVQKGLVETAYDSEIDDFVFWVDKNKEQPKLIKLEKLLWQTV